MTVSNLDAACAALGYRLGTSGGTPKDTENSITKALGVLEEQGVYALFLYLHAREKDLGRKFSKDLMGFLRSKDVGLVQTNGDNEPFGALQELAEDLDRLLFARSLLHQALVYARYHAKAAQAAGAEASDSGNKTESPSPQGAPGPQQKKRTQRRRDRRGSGGRTGR